MTQKIILLFIALSLSFAVNSQSIPEKPNPLKLVNDFAGILSGEETQNLENFLVKFNDETSTQVAVVTVQSLDGTDVGDFAFKLGSKWGIGQSGKNNGILILIKPKYGNDKGHAFIATGYGLEGAVPDAIANRIVNNEMIPHFKNNDYYGGILAAVKIIVELTRGEYTADDYVKKTSGTKFSAFGILFIIIIIFIISKASRSGKTYSRSGSNLPFWLLMSGMASQSHRSGGFGNFSSGSGSFGGFGGGGFGGGGAGGSW